MKANKLLIALMCSVLFVACDNNPEPDPMETGSDNTKDMAVTGAVLNVSSGGATIKGYVNIDQNFIMLIEDYGIEYAVNEGFYNASRVQVDGYTGREFTLSIGGLLPNTTYYYRTYVHQLSGLYNYGKTMSFKTNSIGLVVSNISYTKADICTDEYDEDEYTIYLSTTKDGNYSVYKIYGNYSYATNRYEVIDWFYAGASSVTLSALKPGTTYYCYFSSSRCSTDTVSFTTKALDLSGVKVESKYISTYTSYTDRFGRTVDLSWLGEKYECTFTSNLGSGYKYGVIATDDAADDLDMCKRSENVSDFCHYSSSTSSPYKLTINASVYTEGARLEHLLKLAFNGEADDDELSELDNVIYDVLRGISYRIIKPFIEKDGERIYIE